MLGLILYETVDLFYNIGRLGINCISYGYNSLYGINKEKYSNFEPDNKLYIERLQYLEQRLEKLENNIKQN